MPRRIGPVPVETIAAESSKFTAPMVLVHGLWCTPAVWRRFMGYFAHRGWTCYAINFSGSGGEQIDIAAVRFTQCANTVRQALEACEAPPVVVGHDLGALLALCCASARLRAVVAIAPLVPRGLAAVAQQALGGWRSRWARLRSRPLPPPRGRTGQAFFGGAVPGGAVPDSPVVAYEVASGGLSCPDATGVPTLIVAGARDLVCPAEAAARLGEHLRATVQRVEDGGHGLPWDRGWERRVADIHRWLVQTLGEPLLAMRDEEDDEGT